MALTVIAGCSMLWGDGLDGGEGEIRLVDEKRGIEIRAEEEDCGSEAEGLECEYEAVISGAGGYDGTYSFTLRYAGDGAIVVVDARDDQRDAAFSGEFEILPAGMVEGDEESESEDGNIMTIELDDATASAEDADGDEVAGCREYDLTLGWAGKNAEAVVCDGVGLVVLSTPEHGGVTLRRER